MKLPKSPAFALGILLLLAVPASAQKKKKPEPPRDAPPVGKGPVYLLETFETTAPGKIPKGYEKQGDIAVVEGVAHTGRRSLRIGQAVNGPRRITIKGKVPESLGSKHWGRLYFRVQVPTAVPKSGVIHSTLVSARGSSPLHNDPIEFRPLDTVMNTKGLYQYIYNVQPRKRPEFANGSGYEYTFTDAWTLAEWHVDHDTQTYRLFINGKEIRKVGFMNGKGNFEGTEIPAAVESVSFGWWNYQKAEPGFVAWIDDIALGRDRLGNRGVPSSRRRR